MATSANVDDAATAMQTSTFPVSMLRCKRTGRVLFLEAGKDFVDSLFGFLLLPVGTIHMLASAGVDEKGLGGISRLIESMKQLDRSVLHVDKQYLLQPKPAITGTCNSIGLIQVLNAAKLKSIDSVLPDKYYRCNSGCCRKLSSTQDTPCNDCRPHYGRSYSFAGQVYSVIPGDLEKLKKEIVKKLNVDSVAVGSRSTGQGFVRDNITYMVTEQLEVMPSSTIKNINVLKKLKVSTLSDLKRSEVAVNITQIFQLLKAAMTSSTCLSDVFGKEAGRYY